MARRPDKKAPARNPPKPAGKNPPPAAAIAPRPSGWKVWRFRLLAAFGAPLLFLILLEAGLRLTGFGYPTSFLLPQDHGGRKTFSQNNQFGWRFFGPQMAREPAPFSIARSKPAGVVRIFVFGESAAYGDPDPAFGVSRMLLAMLELRYPGVKFEVINTALTGINSNVILPIARDCAKADGDIWVIYMGNNEVVGPFGGGTVFGSQAPPVAMIRAGLALKTTRTGELLDTLVRLLHKPPPEKSEWGGMLMFVDQQLRAEDPRMNAVYRNFQQNLADIIAAGHRRGAGIVVSTVGVNLRECAPFGSAHRPGLSDSQKTMWDQDYQAGVMAQNSSAFSIAAARFRDAAAIDDTFADLRFRQATCALALGDAPEARKQFAAARDLDTLRFRCDSRLNDLIRQTASHREAEHILFADSEASFAQNSDAGIPGTNLFYEHVHLKFHGNYLLAQTLAPQIAKLLPGAVASRIPAAQPWPSEDDCARRLGWSDWNLYSSLSEIANRISSPPFTGQINHDVQLQNLKALMARTAPASQMAGLRDAHRRCEAAVSLAPDDPVLRGQLASFYHMDGNLTNAEIEIRHALELLPDCSEFWSDYGTVLAAQQRYPEAADSFQRAFKLDPEDVWSICNHAEALIKLDRRDEAVREYHRALAVKPRFGPAWLSLGQLLEQMGRKTEAEDCYHKALANPVHRAPELTSLARFCRDRGWFVDAIKNYDEAIQLNPEDAVLYYEAAQCLDSLNRHDEAAARFAEAERLAPDSEQVHFLYGIELGRAGKMDGAIAEFREAVRIMPDLVEARLNLGIALSQAGSNVEALAQFQEVLQRSPTNALAQQYSETLRAKIPGTPGH